VIARSIGQKRRANYDLHGRNHLHDAWRRAVGTRALSTRQPWSRSIYDGVPGLHLRSATMAYHVAMDGSSEASMGVCRYEVLLEMTRATLEFACSEDLQIRKLRGLAMRRRGHQASTGLELTNTCI